MDNQYMSAKSKYQDVKFIYDNQPSEFRTKSSWRVLETIWLYLNKAAAAAFSFTTTCIKFVGQVAEVTVNVLSRLISIRIGLFDAQKVELCEEIAKLKGELAEKKLQNKRLDSENYLLNNALVELENGGNLCYDKVVQWFGQDCEPAVRWRGALLKSNSSRGFLYEEASEYHEARKSQQWLEEYEAKKKDGERKVRPSSKRKRKR